MAFQKAALFREKEPKKVSGQMVEVYDYQHPDQALMIKNRLFIMGVIIFVLALASYILDLVFASGKNLFPYGFTLASIPGILLAFFIPIELYRHRDVPGNLPLNKVSKCHAQGCPLRFILLWIGLILVLIARLVLALMLNNGSLQAEANQMVEWGQVAMAGLSVLLMTIVVIVTFRLNRRDLKKVTKPIEESSYAAQDLIRRWRPFSWMFIILLAVMMFFITPLF